MIDVVSVIMRLLTDAGYTASRLVLDGNEALAFEDPTVLGFVFTYPSSKALLSGWRRDSERTLRSYQLALRRAQTKAWNVYTLFITTGAANYAERVALSAIEEDLVATRKIAREGVDSVEEMRIALLALLPFQSAPRLEAVDIAHEIRLRTQELPTRAVEAFLSEQDELLVMQVLEESP